MLTNVAESAPRQDASCSKVASYFPKSVARVCNSGAPLSLLYPIEVLRSRPLTHCFLSCMIGEDREEEDQQCGSLHRKSECRQHVQIHNMLRDHLTFHLRIFNEIT